MQEGTAQVPNTTFCCAPLASASLTATEADTLVTMLKAVADPVRLRLINMISQAGEACACDLPAALDRSQPTVSHHLKVLVDAGLLHREKRGKWAWFRVEPEQLQALSDVFKPDALQQPAKVDELAG